MNDAALLRLRETKFAQADFDRVQLDGVFRGYASLFGEVDLGNDKVLPGAFSAALARRGADGVRMLFQHDPAQPIGVWDEIVEDARGLRVAGRLTTTTAKGREVLELMRAGAIDGLSIGFRTVRSRVEKPGRTRAILEADLWEISVVTFPMQPGARIDRLKSARVPLPSVREFEHWLTRDAGLTRGEARTVIAKGFVHLAGEREAAGATPDLAGVIRSAAGRVRPSHSYRNQA